MSPCQRVHMSSCNHILRTFWIHPCQKQCKSISWPMVLCSAFLSSENMCLLWFLADGVNGPGFCWSLTSHLFFSPFIKEVFLVKRVCMYVKLLPYLRMGPFAHHFERLPNCCSSAQRQTNNKRKRPLEGDMMSYLAVIFIGLIWEFTRVWKDFRVTYVIPFVVADAPSAADILAPAGLFFGAVFIS